MTGSGDAKGRVAIVGAGPGAADLLTVRALEEIRAADIIFIDRLVGPEIRALLPPDAEVIDVGKARGSGPDQSSITDALIRRALSGRRVVRLKGGDPFVFGRGSEEVAAITEAGIPCIVVPGITSAFAAPASIGIPVTHRGLSSSVCVLTATEADGLRSDWSPAATAETVVVLMGLTSIGDVCSALIAARGNPDEPAAAIQAASTPTQRSVVTTLAELPEAAADLIAPTTLVIGPTVALAEPQTVKPSVWVTRPIRQVGRLVRELEDRGIASLVDPVLHVTFTHDPSIADTDGISWFLFTSRNGSEAFASALLASGRGGRDLAGIRFACIGPATAEPLRPLVGEPDLVPDTYSVESLIDAFPEGHGSVAVIGGNMTDPRLMQALEADGWQVQHRLAYETTTSPSLSVSTVEMLERSQVSAVLLTSAETARSCAQLMHAAGLDPKGLPAVCIGEPTTEAASSEGFPIASTAESATATSLAEATSAWLRARTG
jgi:uroporphyrinogen III methyltransferase / synthase